MLEHSVFVCCFCFYFICFAQNAIWKNVLEKKNRKEFGKRKERKRGALPVGLVAQPPLVHFSHARPNWRPRARPAARPLSLLSLFRWQSGPTRQRVPSPSSTQNRTGLFPRVDSIPGTADFLALFANQAPIKLPLQSRSFRLHRSRKKSSPRRPSEAWLDLTGADLVLLRGALTSFPLGPNQARRRARGEFLSLPVLSVSFLAQGFASSGKPGELHGGAHGAAAPCLSPVAGPPPLAPWTRPSRWIKI